MNCKEITLIDPVTSLAMADGDFFTTLPVIGAGMPVAGVKTVDKGAAFEIEVKSPGFEKKDLKVSVKDGVLTVAGCRKEEKKAKTAGGWSETSSESSFVRSMPLPAGINAKKTKIAYRNGALRLTLPKKSGSARK